LKVQDVYTEQEFIDLLDEAESNAKNSWEETFVSDMREKFNEYNVRMYISDKQDEILNRIANDE